MKALLGTFGSISILFNCLLMIIFRSEPRLLEELSNIFVFHLSIANMIIGLSDVFQAIIYDIYNTESQATHRILIKTGLAVLVASYFSSLLHVLAMTITRLIAILFPLKERFLLRFSRLRLITYLNWGVSVLMFVLVLVTGLLSSHLATFYGYTITFTLFSSIIVIIAAYAIQFKIVLRHLRHIQSCLPSVSIELELAKNFFPVAATKYDEGLCGEDVMPEPPVSLRHFDNLCYENDIATPGRSVRQISANAANERGSFEIMLPAVQNSATARANECIMPKIEPLIGQCSANVPAEDYDSIAMEFTVGQNSATAYANECSMPKIEPLIGQYSANVSAEYNDSVAMEFSVGQTSANLPAEDYNSIAMEFAVDQKSGNISSAKWGMIETACPVDQNSSFLSAAGNDSTKTVPSAGQTFPKVFCKAEWPKRNRPDLDLAVDVANLSSHCRKSEILSKKEVESGEKVDGKIAKSYEFDSTLKLEGAKSQTGDQGSTIIFNGGMENREEAIKEPEPAMMSSISNYIDLRGRPANDRSSRPGMALNDFQSSTKDRKPMIANMIKLKKELRALLYCLGISFAFIMTWFCTALGALGLLINDKFLTSPSLSDIADIAVAFGASFNSMIYVMTNRKIRQTAKRRMQRVFRCF